MDATVLIIQKSSDVNELSTSTLTISNESFLMSTEVQLTENLNRTTEGTDRYSKILDVINPSTTPPKHIETTLEITDVQNITTDITEKNQQNELLWYIYIVIPLAVFFFVVCIGCIIRRRLHRRKRSSE
ncbi:unnamed protein product [Schistosoma bovis]|nr:unnamed protein product [Schistosoma bovis]